MTTENRLEFGPMDPTEVDWEQMRLTLDITGIQMHAEKSLMLERLVLSVS